MRTSITAVLMLTAGLAAADTVSAQPHNILLIIADDVGTDMIGAYQPLVGSSSVPQTPTIDGLAAQGILFRNAWANPICAATRASIQTGRYGFRTGARGPVGGVSVDEFSIAEMLHRDPNNNHALALFGKWGLASQPGIADPVHMGYDKYAGVLAAQLAATDTYFNFNESIIAYNESTNCNQHVPASYFNSACISTQNPVAIDNYATTQNADDTIAWINAVPNNRPWFVTLAFNAAHTPIHVPPSALVHSSDCASNPTNKQLCYRAMIEAMDTEIKRVLDNVPPAQLSRTTIIFIGDNGSVEGMSVPPFNSAHTKFTLYDGGVNVPLIVAGGDVVTKARVSSALVNASDLFMTVLDLAGFNPSYLPATFANGNPWLHDSHSLLPILRDPCSGGCQIQTMRQFVYAETNYGLNPAGTVTVGNAVRDFFGYKLMLYANNITGRPLTWAFYNLNADPHEGSNLVDPSTGLLLNITDIKAAQALTKLRQLLLGDNVLNPNVLPAPNILPVNAEDPVAHSGDINNDGKVDVADVLLALQHLVGTRALAPAEIARSDMYPLRAGDGALTIADLLLMQKAALSH